MSDGMDAARKAAVEAMEASLSDEVRYFTDGSSSCERAIDAFLAELGAQGMVIVPREPTEAMRAAVSGPVPYNVRRNKLYDDGRLYEVVRMDNEDWREVVSDDQTVMNRFANEKEAVALFDKLEFEFRYAAMLKASEPT